VSIEVFAVCGVAVEVCRRGDFCTDRYSPGATGRLWEAKPPQCVTQASPDSEAYATKI